MALVAKGSMMIGGKKLVDAQFDEEVISRTGYKLKIPTEWKLWKPCLRRRNLSQLITISGTNHYILKFRLKGKKPSRRLQLPFFIRKKPSFRLQRPFYSGRNPPAVCGSLSTPVETFLQFAAAFSTCLEAIFTLSD